MLCTWGITTDGKPVFIALASVSAESQDAAVDFLRDLTGRGLRAPLLVITDGPPGLMSAIEQVLDASLRQRCLVHRARNVIAKVSKSDQGAVKAAFWSIFDGIQADPGDDALADARRRAQAFEDKWQRAYPGAVACVTDAFASLTTHLRFPRPHWARIRHTNLTERTFGETKRRTKVIGRLPGEHSCLSSVWAVLDRASRGWRSVQPDTGRRQAPAADPSSAVGRESAEEVIEKENREAVIEAA